MFDVLARRLLLLAAVSASMLTAASGAAIAPLDAHRDAVDEQSYPWSAIGKLYNESGASCSGVVIARDKVLTAAHCLYNWRSRRFMAAEGLHFLVGYRSGRYLAHARVARFEIGAGFDPNRYDQTSRADWAVLTMTENLPLRVEPLHLLRDGAVDGTPAVLVGYPEDRAFAMTADRNCELGPRSAGYLLHTCRGTKGYSGAPILIRAQDGEMQVAAIQIATVRDGGINRMLAVPAEAIRSHLRKESTDIIAGIERSPPSR